MKLTGTPHHGIAPLTAAIGKIYDDSGPMTLDDIEWLTMKLLVSRSNPCSTILYKCEVSMDLALPSRLITLRDRQGTQIHREL